MRLRVYFENLQDKETLRYSLKMLIRRAIEATLAYEEIDDDCEVSVTLCDNEKIREMNKAYRNIDRETDVLSFPLFDDDGMNAHVEELDCMLGDIVLSLERARAQAEEFGHSFEREVAFLTVHSVLHLLGYDHETGEADEQDMRRRQSEIVDRLGLSVK
ncbi:MAG: rRNA maturation RNase YbeY [Clostridia bacterium]|nr:rRNA maturation RNase YbeY [Clostridia bacterium]